MKKSALLMIALFFGILLAPISNSSKDGNMAFGSETSAACNCVAFRLDDIQDYFLTSAQMEVINTFERNHANLTIGIIGNAFGNDPSMLSFVKEKINPDNTNGTLIEIANHGWNHEDFTTFNKEEQSSMIRQTNEKIFDLLYINPVVFIPPYNAINNDTIDALMANDMHYVSANGTTDYFSNPIPDNDRVGSSQGNNNTIMHFPSVAATGDLNADNTEWVGFGHNATFASVKASVREHGYAVVTMHPMEFSARNGTKYQNQIDHEQVRELELLISDIESSGLKIVTISQIDHGRAASIPEFPGAIPLFLGTVLTLIILGTRFRLRHTRIAG